MAHFPGPFLKFGQICVFFVIFSIFRGKNTMKTFENRQSEEAKIDFHPQKPPEMSISQKFLRRYPPPLWFVMILPTSMLSWLIFKFLMLIRTIIINIFLKFLKPFRFSKKVQKIKKQYFECHFLFYYISKYRCIYT